MESAHGASAAPFPHPIPPMCVRATEREALSGLRATIEGAPVGIAHFDLAGRFLLVNEKLCEMLGYERRELLARGLREVAFPEDADACMLLNARLAAGAIPSYSLDKRFVRRDGAVVWARIDVSAVREETGIVAFFVGVAQDITFLRDEQERRRRTEDRLHVALEASATGTFRWDMTAGTVQWYRELDRLFGLEGDGGVRTLDEFLSRAHAEDREAVARAIRLCKREGEPVDVDYRVVWPDGSAHWLHAVGRTFGDEHGRPICVTGACTDITSARLTREKLEESDAWLRAVLEASPLGVSAFDARGTLVYFNATSLELRGLSNEEVQAGQYSVTLHPEDQSRVLGGWYEAVRAGEPWSDTYRYVHPRDGKCVWVRAGAAPIRVKGRLVGFVKTVVDITSMKEAEAERERLLRREREAREHAEWAVQARQEMVAVVAHDLRNPLHVISTGVSALQEPTLPPERRQKLIAFIQRNAHLMSRLLDDLLDFSRIAAGRFEVRRGAVDLMRVLDETLESFQASARERRVSLELVDGPAVAPMSADRDRILQVLANLVGNALKFTNAGGRVEVLAEDHADRVELAVRDDGIGMGPQQLAHLFERYWKAEPGSRSGAGLGLAIAKGIVEAHGGSIRAESERGRGTMVRFTIPR
jgi:PAS domain S-box-containing protein